MASTIKLKNGSGAPTAGDLVQGEPALDLTNKRLYTEDAGGNVIEIGTSPSTIDINAGTIDGTVIGGASAAAGTFTTLNATGGGALTGTWSDLGSVTTVDINGGTIDGVTIGGASAGAGTFTTVTASEGLVHTGDSDTFIKFLDNRIYSDVGGNRLFDLQSGTSELNCTGAVEFNTGASLLKRLNIANNGDISFYEDTGTTPKLFWDASAESLGIGTSSPTATLDVSGTIFNNAGGVQFPRQYRNDFTPNSQRADLLYTTNVTSDNALRIGTVATSGGVTLQTTKATSSAVKGNLILNPDGGNVGIGTTSPANAIEIARGSGVSAATSYRGNGNSAADEFFVGQGTTGQAFVYNRASTGITFGTNNATVMIFDSSGNVGIGTTSPSQKLDVSGGSIKLDDSQELRFGTSAVASISGVDGASGYLSFATNGVGNRMRIDSSGNVGIGTTSPAGKLQVKTTGTAVNLYVSSDISTSALASRILLGNSVGTARFTFGLLGGGGEVAYLGSEGSFPLYFQTAGTERMRIDSSGNVGIGTSSPATRLDVASSAGAAGQVNSHIILTRGTTNGAYLATERSAINNDVSALVFGVNSAERARIDSSGMILPGADDAQDLGSLTKRYDDVYATNALIQTSDRNEKQDIEELSEAEKRVAVAAKALMRKFRWKSKVAEKGDDARIHFGIIAQDLQAAFEAEGLDAGRYAMFIHSTWTDEETGEERSRMGVRYSELLAFIIAAI